MSKRMCAMKTQASADAMVRSKSLASLQDLPTQANVLSTRLRGYERFVVSWRQSKGAAHQSGKARIGCPAALAANARRFAKGGAHAR